MRIKLSKPFFNSLVARQRAMAEAQEKYSHAKEIFEREQKAYTDIISPYALEAGLKDKTNCNHTITEADGEFYVEFREISEPTEIRPLLVEN